jgi:hypothetical protein
VQRGGPALELPSSEGVESSIMCSMQVFSQAMWPRIVYTDFEILGAMLGTTGSVR